jgi:hypothetical protein
MCRSRKSGKKKKHPGPAFPDRALVLVKFRICRSVH